MKTDPIEEVGIDDSERLYVKPTAATFDWIYRSAMEIHWDKDKFLWSPKPREWTYFDWFCQIIRATEAEAGASLIITKNTTLKNISEETQSAIKGWMGLRRP